MELEFTMTGKRGSRGSILETRPELIDEWHTSLNGNLSPEEISAGSGTKIWWQCPENSKHVYQATAYSRCGTKRKSNCPFCAGQKVHPEESLEALYPQLMQLWDHKKNVIQPDQVLAGSTKKAWWKCSKGHSWETQIIKVANRNYGCPICSGKKVIRETSFGYLNSELLAEWDYGKNVVDPFSIRSGSSRKVWWKCPAGPDHEWQTSLAMRTGQQTSCPFCANQQVSVTNSLATLFPDIASQLHPKKNGDLKAENIVAGSDRKVWWQCQKFSEHEWTTTVYQRTHEKTNCPKCKPQKSLPEIRVYTELCCIYEDCRTGEKIHGVELDIWIPSLKLGIEYDGSFWHKDKLKKDLKKNTFFKQHEITVLRLREIPLEKIDTNDILVGSAGIEKSDINDLLQTIQRIGHTLPKQAKKYLKANEFQNEDLYKVYVSYFPSPFPENSRLKLDKTAEEFWDYAKNSPLRPENFSPFSSFDAWWKCPINPEHQWRQKLTSRKLGQGCPFCPKPSSKSSDKKKVVRVSKETSFGWLFPDLAEEWEKSNTKTAFEVTAGSGFRAKWRCKKGHIWEAAVYARTLNKSGCSICAGLKPANGESLFDLYPDLMPEWDYKNNNLDPKSVVPGSGKVVFWKCNASEDHCWRAAIRSRTQKKSGCPFCSGSLPSATNNLAIRYPKIVKYWHTGYNDGEPETYLPLSKAEVWWKCPSNPSHVYQAKICNRVRHVGCPWCGRGAEHPK